MGLLWGRFCLLYDLYSDSLRSSHRKGKGKGIGSLRADEIKLWLTPSAKQRRNPCSGLPAVYPDLSTRHDWPVKKDLCFVCRKTDNSQSG